MNKYEEALQRISDIDLDLVLELVGYEQADKISPYGISDYPNLEKSGDIETLKELVEKAIPKKVEKNIESLSYCPVCRCVLAKRNRVTDLNYCHYCGQAIDWSDE